MIKIDSLLYKIDQRFNKLASNEHQAIPLEDKILLIRESEIKLIKQKINPNNALRVGFDGNKKRYQDLQFLVEAPEKHKLVPKISDKKLNRYTVSLTGITPEYMFYVDSYLVCDKGNCKSRIVWVNPDLVAHSDIAGLLNSSNYKPSFEYQETFCDLSHDEIGIYTDGSFEPKELYLSYIRYPKKVNIEDLEDWDGQIGSRQDSELPEYMEDELLDLIIESISRYTENISAYQTSQQSRQSTE